MHVHRIDVIPFWGGIEDSSSSWIYRRDILRTKLLALVFGPWPPSHFEETCSLGLLQWSVQTRQGRLLAEEWLDGSLRKRKNDFPKGGEWHGFLLQILKPRPERKVCVLFYYYCCCCYFYTYCVCHLCSTCLHDLCFIILTSCLPLVIIPFYG